MKNLKILKIPSPLQTKTTLAFISGILFPILAQGDTNIVGCIAAGDLAHLNPPVELCVDSAGRPLAHPSPSASPCTGTSTFTDEDPSIQFCTDSTGRLLQNSPGQTRGGGAGGCLGYHDTALVIHPKNYCHDPHRGVLRTGNQVISGGATPVPVPCATVTAPPCNPAAICDVHNLRINDSTGLDNALAALPLFAGKVLAPPTAIPSASPPPDYFNSLNSAASDGDTVPSTTPSQGNQPFSGNFKASNKRRIGGGGGNSNDPFSGLLEDDPNQKKGTNGDSDGESLGTNEGGATYSGGGAKKDGGRNPGSSVYGIGKTGTQNFGPSGGPEGIQSEDPEDYFTRINLDDSIFKIVHKRYQIKTAPWFNAVLPSGRPKIP